MKNIIECVAVGSCIALAMLVTFLTVIDPGCCHLLGHFDGCDFGRAATLLVMPALIIFGASIVAIISLED